MSLNRRLPIQIAWRRLLRVQCNGWQFYHLWCLEWGRWREKCFGGEYEMLINTKFNVYKIPSCWRLLTELAGSMTVPGRLWRHIDAIWHDHSHVFHRQRLQRLTATVPSLELLPPQSADKTVASAKLNLKKLNFIEIWGFPKMVGLLKMIILGCFGGTTI